MVAGGGEDGVDGFGCFGGGAGGEDVGAGDGHAEEDAGDLFGGLAGGVDNLGEAGAEGAVVVDAGIAQVFEGEVGKAGGGLLGGEGLVLDFGEEGEEGGGGHGILVRC